MGNSSSNNNDQVNDLNHLTNNSDNRDILRTLFQANNNIVLNQMYYNQYNINGNNDNLNPIKIKKAVPLKAQISLIKKSLKIIKSNQKPSCFYLTFIFSCLSDIEITIYLSAIEEKNEETKKTIWYFNKIMFKYTNENSIKQKNSLVENFGKTYHFEPCKKFSFTEENFFIDKNFLENKENLKISEKYYPLIIKMETSNIFIDKEIHYTYATLTKMDEDNYLIETIKQKIEMKDKALLMHEIYGIETTNEHKNLEEDNDDLKCSICLTEKSNIIVYPCEHLCICYKCCLDLRAKTSKCPICRDKIESFIKVQGKKKR